MWPDPIPHEGKGSETWPLSGLSLGKLISMQSSHNVSYSNHQNVTCNLAARVIQVFEFMTQDSSFLTLQVDSPLMLKFPIKLNYIPQVACD